MVRGGKVYLVGAGLNQCVNDWHGLKPPLATDFFANALRSEKYGAEHYSSRVSCLYEYIEKYWKKSKDDLLTEPFDLEDCFTLLQLQSYEAARIGDEDRVHGLAIIDFRLKALLAEFLSEFEHFAVASDLLREFGKRVHRERPTIITFNYDCLLETAIETASGMPTEIPHSIINPPTPNASIPDEELPYSHFNWNRPLGYGIEFDEVQLQRAGLPAFVDGGRFYSHPENDLYDWKILKLHGSLNWFRYLPIRKWSLPGMVDQLSRDELQEVILVNGHWWFNEPPDRNGWLIDPLIITPTLYKTKLYEEEIFPRLWDQARLHLAECSSLIVIGYSFPQLILR